MIYKIFCLRVAKQAGVVIRKNFRHGMKKSWKANDTPVTKTDLQINRTVIAAVRKHFPAHDVLGEEESYLKNESEFLWVCDPVDGTVPFSHGLPVCVFSLALVKDGKPVVGVIYDAFFDRLVYAELGRGAYLNGQRIRVSRQTMDLAVLNWESLRSINALQAKFPTCKPLGLQCFIYGAMLVAMGELVASVYTWNYAHDAASAKIVIEEAGGKATDLQGHNQRYDGRVNGMLVSNGVVHPQLLRILKPYYRRSHPLPG